MRTILAVSLLAAVAAWAQDQPAAQTSTPPQTDTQQQTAPAQPQAAPQQAPATTPTQQTEAAPAPTQAPAATTQQPAIRRTNLTELFNGPTLSEVYCAGFISKDSIKPIGTVLAGNNSPEQVHYMAPDYVFLSGSELQEGKEYQLLRHAVDPNQYESFPGQLGILRNLGQLYQDLGRAKVLYIRNKTAVAQIESSCSDTMPGDIAVPFRKGRDLSSSKRNSSALLLRTERLPDG